MKRRYLVSVLLAVVMVLLTTTICYGANDTYSDEDRNLYLEYPSTWEPIEVYDDKGNARRFMTFIDSEGKLGCDMFITYTYDTDNETYYSYDNNQYELEDYADNFGNTQIKRVYDTNKSFGKTYEIVSIDGGRIAYVPSGWNSDMGLNEYIVKAKNVETGDEVTQVCFVSPEEDVYHYVFIYTILDESVGVKDVEATALSINSASSFNCYSLLDWDGMDDTDKNKDINQYMSDDDPEFDYSYKKDSVFNSDVEFFQNLDDLIPAISALMSWLIAIVVGLIIVKATVKRRRRSYNTIEGQVKTKKHQVKETCEEFSEHEHVEVLNVNDKYERDLQVLVKSGLVTKREYHELIEKHKKY